MILISHRGNISGSNSEKENSLPYIQNAINLGYDVEIDLWVINGKLFLGHDEPQYEINLTWLIDRISKLWIHCKNIDSVIFLKFSEYKFNYFWHENDTVTLTSTNMIWAHPGKQPISESIAVMPEINNDDTTKCIGICSDYIKNYDKKKNNY